jgi:hypothetical protein
VHGGVVLAVIVGWLRKVEDYDGLRGCTDATRKIRLNNRRGFQLDSLVPNWGGYAVQVVRVSQPEEVRRGDGYPFSRTEKH